MDKYAIIVEHKSEKPLIIEQYVGAGDYESVATKMQAIKDNKDVIRVCMVRLEYETGNEDLLK